MQSQSQITRIVPTAQAEISFRKYFATLSITWKRHCDPNYRQEIHIEEDK